MPMKWIYNQNLNAYVCPKCGLRVKNKLYCTCPKCKNNNSGLPDWAIDLADEIIVDGNFEAAVEMMDDEIREQLHAEIAPCSSFMFLTAYIVKHKEKYDEEFGVI